MPFLSNTQKIIRANARHARKALSAEYREIASGEIANQLILKLLNNKYQKIAVYLSTAEEVNLTKVIQWGFQHAKKLYAPKIKFPDKDKADKADKAELDFVLLTPETPLKMGKFSVREPCDFLQSEKISPQELDVVLVPLVAFDENLNRVGMGGGFYDRAFGDKAFCDRDSETSSPLLIGCAFECQKVDQIISNPWDVRLDRVITEKAQY